MEDTAQWRLPLANKNEKPIPNRRNRIIWGLSIGLLFIALIFFLLWLLIFRFHKTTDDAYVSGNQVVITPQISGFITFVTVEDTELVEEGHILVQLDTIDQTVNLEKAKSELADTVRNVAQLFENVGKLKANVEMRKSEVAKTGQDYEHRKKLIDSGAISVEDFQHAEAFFIEAFASLLAAQHELSAAEALVEGTTIPTHPLVEKAKAATKEAFVNLQRCTIRSPVKGLVANKQAQVGEAIAPNSPLMTIVPLDQIWIDANYKEVQLKKVRIGQPATMTADIYGSDVVYRGKVIGISAATGSVLSVLPPQNATGNWIKIVQRLPVRIQLDPEQIKDHPLRLGLSMYVKVDVSDTKGELIPALSSSQPLFKTNIFEGQELGADELINKIIADNSKTLTATPDGTLHDGEPSSSATDSDFTDGVAPQTAIPKGTLHDGEPSSSVTGESVAPNPTNKSPTTDSDFTDGVAPRTASPKDTLHDEEPSCPVIEESDEECGCDSDLTSCNAEGISELQGNDVGK